MRQPVDRYCPEYYANEETQACIPYFYNIFNNIRYTFKKYTDKYKAEIDKIDDPILRHIAIYLVENYDEVKIYFSRDGRWQLNYACELLNEWLDNKKSYFTHALHCKGNVQLWDQTIEPLWKKLESDYQNVEQSEKKWCTRKKYFKPYLEIPKKLYPPTCYKHVPKKYKCVRPFPPNKCSLQNTCNSVKKYYEMCKSEEVNVPYLPSMFSEAIANGDSPFKDIDDVTFSRQVQTHCDCHSSNYATVISVCVSFFGTVLILFLLNKVI